MFASASKDDRSLVRHFPVNLGGTTFRVSVIYGNVLWFPL